MKKFLILILTLCSLTVKSQTVSVSTGIDWFFLPFIDGGKLFTPQTYSIGYNQLIYKDFLSIGLKVRYTAYPGSNYQDLQGNRIHNYGPGDKKIFTDLAYDRGLLNYGRFANRWNYHSITLGLIPKLRVAKFRAFSLDLFISAYLDRHFISDLYLIVNEGVLSDPDGNETDYADVYYLNQGYVSFGNGGGLQANYSLTDLLSISLDGEFMFFYWGHAYFYSNLSVNYKF